MLVVEKLTKSYGARDLLSDVSFTVNAGEKVGVVGPNGAGKTTLLKIIAGDERLNTGKVITSEGTLSYLHQEADVDLESSLNEEMWSALADLSELKSRISNVEESLIIGDGDLDALSDELNKLNERFKLLGGNSVDASIGRVTSGFVFATRIDFVFAVVVSGTTA